MERSDSVRHGFAYQLNRSKRKTVALIVHQDNRLEIRCPNRYPVWKIDRFLAQKADWIQKKQRQNALRVDLPDLNLLNDREIHSIRDLLMERIMNILWDYTGPLPEKWSLRRLRSRWGSCSSKKQISINLLSYYLPDPLLKYLIFHELAHLTYMNHSIHYWTYLETRMPEAKQLRKALHRYRLPA